MNELNQLLLEFDYKTNFNEHDFYLSKSNYSAFNLIDRWPDWDKKILNISGEKFSGKSHLANIFKSKSKAFLIKGNIIDNSIFKTLKLYENIIIDDFDECKKEGLDINFSSPVTNHELSDNCGVDILGAEENNFWKDNKGANINSIRTKKSIEDSDVVIVKFGEKYKQWNAAFDAGYASALNKSIVVIHGDEHQHPLKEVDAAACAVTKDQSQAVKILKYIVQGSL